ncbi:MAG: T9SS type A sorting domain-containing protein, partial [Bacteroidota bacterium]
MKKIMLLLFLIIGSTAFAQKTVNTTGSSQFTAPIIDNPYGPGEQIHVEYFATNNATNDLFINPVFQLLADDEVVYELATESIVLDTQTEDGTISFVFPDNCTIPNGEYELRFVVNYSQPASASSPVTYTTRDGDFDVICNDQNIPAEEPYTSPDCEVFVLTVVFENEGSCCILDPVITLEDYPFHPPHPWKSCKWWVRATVDWGDDPAPKFNAEWNTGHNGLSTVHPCGIEDYFITISWQENGEWCSKVSETIEVRSYCACAHSYPRLLEIGTVTNETFFNLYPNPNDGNFNILLPLSKAASTLEVWNSLGVKIAELSGTFENSVPVELGAVEAGIYLLRVQYEDGLQESKQFIIE